MNWINTNDQKPPHYKAVVGWCVEADQYRVLALGEGDIWFGQDGRNLNPADYPAFWIELPEPPRV